jgi:hypothetical protein
MVKEHLPGRISRAVEVVFEPGDAPPALDRSTESRGTTKGVIRVGENWSPIADVCKYYRDLQAVTTMMES